MRALALLCCLGSASLAVAQGTYKPAGGEEARWSINPNHVLLWNATPYLPFGLRISASEREILAAKAAGVGDVLVDCPANPTVLKSSVATLEAQGLRYLLCIDSLAPTSRGIVVEPQGNRITGITSKRQLDFRIPGAEEALVVLAVRRDGTIQNTQRVKAQNGAFSVVVDPPNDLDHVAMVYPVTANMARLDAFEAFDQHRDAVLTSLKGAGLGKGLRGIVNPLGSFLAQSGNRTFVPTSPLFRLEFAAFLKQRYRTPQTAMRSWAMSGTEEKDFDALARLVPLWSGVRGTSSLWDPVSNQLFLCEMRRSSIWRDLEQVLSTAEARRSERLIASIRKIADVPIVQEWSGWAPLYEGAPHGLDGLGARSAGTTPSMISDTATRAVSSLMRWAKPGWLLATNVDFAGSPDAATQLNPVFEDLLSMGIRGGFLRSEQPALITAINQLAGQKGADGSLAQWTAKPIFFPEAARNPANPMRLPGGSWWLPAPGSGLRVNLGTQFFAYRQDGPGGPSFALWARSGRSRVKLDLAPSQIAQFRTVDGTDPKPKNVKGGVEVELGEFPLLISGVDEIPVPQPAFDEAVNRFAALVAEADRRLSDTTEERFTFRDYLAGYQRNPGGSFAMMQGVLAKLSNRLARHLWIEAESSRESNFSEVAPVPGVSAGQVLALRTQLESSASEYTAEYTVQPRTEEELEVWVAARLSKSERDLFKLTIGGQTMGIEGEPVSGYGPGFAWYLLGRTRMGRSQTKFSIQILAPEGADLAIDAILFYPGTFRPDGVAPPFAVNLSPPSLARP